MIILTIMRWNVMQAKGFCKFLSIISTIKVSNLKKKKKKEEALEPAN